MSYPDPTAFVRWFRNSSPYIHAHRGRVFVVSFGGEAVADGLFEPLVHDFALLNSLGIRLVLVHGIRPQVGRRLQAAGIQEQYAEGLRITDPAALACVKEAAGTVRVEIEALLSMGLANSPMHGARIRVASGNFVIARPLGVRNGVDFQHTGQVRRIDAEAIRDNLDQGNVVLISPIGYSPTGEVFNLSAEEVATAVAGALKADKLLLLTEQACRREGEPAVMAQLTVAEAQAVLAEAGTLEPSMAAHLRAAVEACRSGVQRSHLLDRHIDGAILQELFTRDGVGTLVSAAPFEELRPAAISDVGGILDLIKPLEADGVLVSRSRERLETEIDDYTVIERDGLIIGCGALHPYSDEATGELACLALHGEYRGGKRGERLLEHLEGKASSLGLQSLFVLTTHASHWFREHGFQPGEPADLPAERQASYNAWRKSKVLLKSLDSPPILNY